MRHSVERSREEDAVADFTREEERGALERTHVQHAVLREQVDERERRRRLQSDPIQFNSIRKFEYNRIQSTRTDSNRIESAY